MDIDYIRQECRLNNYINNLDNEIKLNDQKIGAKR